jgi:uncharacterized membrane protein YjgN (DUF898 family)
MSDEEVAAALRRRGRSRGSSEGGCYGPAQIPDYGGRAGEVAGIAVTNGLLGVLTLGFYRFWGKTRLRRYLWGRVSFYGDPFEYTGTGMELFVGFLVAIAVLIPLGAIASALEFTFPSNQAALAIGAAVQGLVIAYLMQFAIYRARRYRLTRSQWRGIRAGQSGSAPAYAVAALVWWIVTAITLGLAYPVMRTRLQRYRTENTWLGTERFTFAGRTAPMLGRWLVAWLLLIPTLGLSYAWYRACEFRYFAANTRYGTLAFQSGLSTGRVIWLWLRYVLVLIAILAVVAVAAGALFPSLIRVAQSLGSGDAATIEATSQAFGPPVVLMLVGLSFVIGIAANAVRLAVYVHPMLGEICRGLEIEGEADFEAILQSQQARPRRGEGFADALDVGSI